MSTSRLTGQQNYLTIKRNEVLINTTTWVNLGNNKLSERSQTYCIIPFTWNVQMGHSVVRRDVSDCLGPGERMERLRSDDRWLKDSVWKCSELDFDDKWTTLWIVYFKWLRRVVCELDPKAIIHVFVVLFVCVCASVCACVFVYVCVPQNDNRGRGCDTVLWSFLSSCLPVKWESPGLQELGRRRS